MSDEKVGNCKGLEKCNRYYGCPHVDNTLAFMDCWIFEEIIKKEQDQVVASTLEE